MTKKDKLSQWPNILTFITVIIAVIVFTFGSCYDINLNTDKEIALIDGKISELSLNTEGEATVNYLTHNEKNYLKWETIPTRRGTTILLEETIKSGVIRDKEILRVLIVLQINYNDMNNNLNTANEEFRIKHLDDDKIVLAKQAAIESIKNAIKHAKVISENTLTAKQKLSEYKEKLNKSRP